MKRIGKPGESLVRIPFGRDSCDDLDQIFILIDHVEKPVATLDRILGTRFGVGAVQLIQEKKFGHMVSYLNYQIGAVSIKEAVGQIKHVPPDGQMVTTAKAVGINFGV